MMLLIVTYCYGISTVLSTCPLEKAAVPSSNAVFVGNPFDTYNLAIKVCTKLHL